MYQSHVFKGSNYEKTNIYGPLIAGLNNTLVSALLLVNGHFLNIINSCKNKNYTSYSNLEDYQNLITLSQ